MKDEGYWHNLGTRLDHWRTDPGTGLQTRNAVAPPPETDRIKFRNWTSEDVSLVEALFQSEEVAKPLGGPFTHERAVEWLKREVDNGRYLGMQRWPMCLRDTGEFIGCCGLLRNDPANKAWDISIYLCCDQWRKGFGSEALIAVVDYAFDRLNVETIFGGPTADNPRFARALERAGFTRGQEGRSRYMLTWTHPRPLRRPLR